MDICTVVRYISPMITSFRDDGLEAFFESNRRWKQIPPDLEDRLFRRLQMLDDAAATKDLRVPPSNRFEWLKGSLAGLASIRVNKQWRLIFEWDEDTGEAHNVYLDKHTYR